VIDILEFPQQQQYSQQQYQNNYQQAYQYQNNANWAAGAQQTAQPNQSYSILNQQTNQFAATPAAPNNRYQMNQQWQNMPKQNAQSQSKQAVAAQIKAAKFAMAMKKNPNLNNRAAAPNALQKKSGSTGSQKKKDEAFPKSLVVFVQKCFGMLKSVTNNPERDRAEVHEELKAIIARAKGTGSLHKTDWEKQEYPPKLKRLVDASRKRKRDYSHGSNKRRKRGPSPASFGNTFYKKQRNESSDSEDVGWKNNRQKKGKMGKRKNNKKNNFNNKVNNQADSWFAEAESDNINAARAKRAKRFGASMLKKKTFDWRKPAENKVIKAYDFESAKITGTNRTVLREFLRLTREARPEEVRTKDTCAITLNVIQRKWREERDYRWCESQLKSLRQDLKVQHIRDKLAVRTYESHARICLEVSDISEYNQCQTALRSLYEDDARNRQNEKEFVVYRILYLSVINDYAGYLRAIGHKRTRDDKFVKLCVRLYRGFKTGNYVEVFNAYKQLPKLAQNLFNQVKEKVRFEALTKICSSFCPQPFPIELVKQSLGFDDFKETTEYLRECQIRLTKDGKNIDTRNSKGKVVQYVVKSKDDQHGITHGSLGVQSGDKAQEAETISHFLKKYS